MNNNLLIKKYQPINFNTYENNFEIINILKTLILIDDLNILLLGNTCSGKTTLLNTLISEYFQGFSPNEYNLNILIINNLKELGINYYRNDVKTFCQTCSTIHNKKKLVILDDIDLINEQSQQIFRNCIDKYSNNVNFICSCSNIYKVIESIQSRLNILKINSFSRENLENIFEKIKLNENIEITNEAKDFILNISNNNVKTLINYMEKFKLFNNKIELNNAIELTSNISFLTFDNLTKLILEKDLKNSIKLINSFYENGYSVIDILDNYFIYLKNSSLFDDKQKYNITSIICKYISIFHIIHEDEIELSLFVNNLIKII
jgi:DNA polymerase III delta prime subunit